MFVTPFLSLLPDGSSKQLGLTNNTQELCSLHNAASPPPSSPAATPTPTPEPSVAPPPPHTASCKVIEQGLGGGKWEVTGSGWGDEASLKAKFGDDSFNYTAGDPFTANFVSGMSADDVRDAVREMSGVGDVTCT
jgi:hypothetical protein